MCVCERKCDCDSLSDIRSAGTAVRRFVALLRRCSLSSPLPSGVLVLCVAPVIVVHRPSSGAVLDISSLPSILYPLPTSILQLRFVGSPQPLPSQQPAYLLCQRPAYLFCQQPAALHFQHPAYLLCQQPAALHSQRPASLLCQQPAAFALLAASSFAFPAASMFALPAACSLRTSSGQQLRLPSNQHTRPPSATPQ